MLDLFFLPRAATSFWACWSWAWYQKAACSGVRAETAAVPGRGRLATMLDLFFLPRAAIWALWAASWAWGACWAQYHSALACGLLSRERTSGVPGRGRDLFFLPRALTSFWACWSWAWYQKAACSGVRPETAAPC